MKSNESRQADGFKTQLQATRYRADAQLAAGHMGMPSTNHPFVIICRRGPEHSTVKSGSEGHLTWDYQRRKLCLI